MFYEVVLLSPLMLRGKQSSSVNTKGVNYLFLFFQYFWCSGILLSCLFFLLYFNILLKIFFNICVLFSSHSLLIHKINFQMLIKLLFFFKVVSYLSPCVLHVFWCRRAHGNMLNVLAFCFSFYTILLYLLGEKNIIKNCLQGLSLSLSYLVYDCICLALRLRKAASWNIGLQFFGLKKKYMKLQMS